MSSSDEEGEIVPNCVTDYHLLNHEDKLVSFSALPLQWRQSEPVVQSENHVFLLANAAEDGLQKVHKRVVAWKFDLSFLQPEVLVLSKDMKWISLLKPRKSFESTVRTVLVTLHWLHFLKKNPETMGKDLWSHLNKAFSSFEVEPSGKDLFDHMPLVTEAIKRDKDLAKCKNPLMLMERPRENTDPNEDVQITKKSKFIVDMDEDEDEDDRNDSEGSDGDDGLYDHVCALCDNGGEILCCQGRCLRSFHATINAGAGYCQSLGFQDAQVNAIPTFLCANCKYKQHQCFVCGKLGSSDNSDQAEVFPCISATCGHFYHPKCVARLLEPVNKSQAEELQYKIASGESFTCPVHKCFVCKQGEAKKVHELQFAICRRCPRSYHRKCLPREISFEKSYDENIRQRAWENLLPNRILIYCLDHEIIRELETPARDHVQFPDVKGQQKLQSLEFTRKKRMQVSSNAMANLPKRVVKGSNGINTYSTQPFWKTRDVPSVRTKPTIANGIARSSKENIGTASWGFVPKRDGKLPMHCNSSIISKTSPAKSKGNIASVVERKATRVSVIRKANGPSSSAQADMENRMLALIKESTSSFNREEFMERRKLTSICELFSANLLENTITMGKVEGSVKAIQTALKKLDEGCSIEDAKAVCEPEILAQFLKWKRKLSIYLAPFLHGMRYTSFGRHFTKVDKLKEVVNRLHCYVENGDTIVDFCCGSNDFSILMKEKLEKTGKQCGFKNFDLITPKIDFCFEQRDWMSIKLEELPMGSQLIMGLNPPFGVKASLANKFIDKALQFRPKLLILIVPEETKRVDQKRIPYDLIWEDTAILSGKSFYLPGSIDMHNKQIDDWNVKPPPLYLWSRRDWTARHKEVAKEHGHILQEPFAEGNNARNYLMEENYDSSQDHFSLHDSDVSSMLDDFLDDMDKCQDVEGYEGRGQTEKLIQEDSESDMCIDMEISSPSHSPTCFRALHEAFGTPETEEMEKGSQYKLHKPSNGYMIGNRNPEIHYHGSSSNKCDIHYSQTLTVNGSGSYKMM